MLDHYFKQLNNDLKIAGTGLPQLIIDEKVLMQNIDFVNQSLKIASHLRPRIVVKSLACMHLIELVAKQLETQKFMVFHLPHIEQILGAFPQSDLLLGKPMPVSGLRAFAVKKNEEELQQVQWLIDTIERAEQYLAVAQQFNFKLKLNIEIDVGLHRGGVESISQFDQICQLIERNLNHLTLSGLMGYDAHVSKIPKIIKKPQIAYAESQQLYASYVEYLKANFPSLFKDDLCFNGGGSSTFNFHVKHGVCNDLSFGSMLLKPSDFDFEYLSSFKPALYIACPVLKVLNTVSLPGVPLFKKIKALNKHQAVFLYGGYWMGQYVYPPKSHPHLLYGRSTNQEMICVDQKIKIQPDDYVFIRPSQSEVILPQFSHCYIYRTSKQLNSSHLMSNSFEPWENFRE